VPTFQTLSAEELTAKTVKSPIAIDLTEYLDFLQDLGPGDGGEVTLSQGESRRAVKRRLTTAGKRQGKTVRWKSSQNSHNGVLRFEIR